MPSLWDEASATRLFIPIPVGTTSKRCSDHQWYETPAGLTVDGRLVDR
jgi:hypothetical protein